MNDSTEIIILVLVTLGVTAIFILIVEVALLLSHMPVLIHAAIRWLHAGAEFTEAVHRRNEQWWAEHELMSSIGSSPQPAPGHARQRSDS